MHTPTPPRPRKRSRAVVLTTLTAFGAAATLTACEGDIDESRLSEQQYGKAVTAFPYQSLAECKADDKVPDQECEAAERTAREQNELGAPRFESQALCEEEFGNNNCNRGNGGSGSFFTPLLTGFVIGQMLDGGSRYRYSPMYRSRRQDVYYTGGGGGGGWLYRSGGGYRVGSQALQPPVATPRVQTRSSVVSRGGFGGRAAMASASSSSRGGGWGGRGG
ncbi:MAG TPA: DUF1190 domain-containing protein [Allosphingosinicella sp.]|jgi:uncharacterized protein YgiB involved in biofilm formation